MSRRVFGIDFTSRPTRQKPITCVEAKLGGTTLEFVGLENWDNFEAFEAFLDSDGPWLAGMDFPFGQSRRFIENIGWPQNWAGYAGHVAGMSRAGFREALDDYRRDRAAGDREHKRLTDELTGAVSSQKLYGVPVALMFYEGVPRLLERDINIPLLRETSSQRTALEAYPGFLARALIGRRPYKQDTRQKQSGEHAEARVAMLKAILAGEAGIDVVAPGWLADDPKADSLDALLCAIQAATAALSGNYGIPPDADALEGWIAGTKPGQTQGSPE